MSTEQRHDPPVISSDSLDLQQLTNEFRQCAAEMKGNCCALLVGQDRQKKIALGESVARESGFNFLKVEIPDLMDDHIPQSIANLRGAFDAAAKKASLLYLDSLEALVNHRGNDGETPEEIGNELYYLCERSKRYDGITVFSANTRDKVSERLFKDFVRVIVEFE